MTAYVPQQKERQNREKGVFYPFNEISIKLLDELIEESRKEIFQEKSSENERKS